MTLQTHPLYIFRPATPADIDAIAALTAKADTGLTTVPKTADGVADYIDQSQRFLSGDPTANRVLFVAEGLDKKGPDKKGPGKNILGISGIIPKLGLERPFYSFKRSRHARRSTLDNPTGKPLSVKYDTLQLTTDFDGYTELASIFLSPEARGKGVARLLSWGRLAFIEMHRDMFETRLMADIRGWVDEAGVSPFWAHLTSKFIQTEFDVADRLSAADGRFIMELLPSLPIMLNLLPDSVNDCAGRPHDLSAGAMNLLLQAGFETTDLCDIFDGGPAIECKAKNTLISRSRFEPETFDHQDGGLRCLHYGGHVEGFRAVIGMADPETKTASKIVSDTLGQNISVSLAYERRQNSGSR